MPSKSAIYIFTRDQDSTTGFMRSSRASTDAVGVVFHWSAGVGRSFKIMVDRDELFIAKLTFGEGDEQAAGDDLNQRCIDCCLKRETITEVELHKLQAE